MTDHPLSPNTPAGSATPRCRRVLLLSRGGALDGEQRQLCNLALHLDRTRFSPVVLMDEHGQCSEELRQGGVEFAVEPTCDWRRFPEMLFCRRDARRVLHWAQTWGVDLVHASNRWKAHYALHLARHMGIPCVMHMRGPMTPRDVAKHGFWNAAAVIAISLRYESELLAMGLPRQKVHVVDDAVDLSSLFPDAEGRSRVRQEWGIGDRVAVGLVGRVEPFKRTIAFLEAVAQVPADVPAVWRVVGQAGPRHYMRQVEATVKRLGLAERVRFDGRRDDMRRVLSALDLLVTLSGGSVLAEAMACRTAVMTARDEHRFSVHARHNETAWCVSSLNPRAVAQGMEMLIANTALRRRLAEAGRTWAAEHLAVGTLAARTQAVYSRVLGA
jgi:glycosyltransferase involved in cell wall biosynthesis